MNYALEEKEEEEEERVGKVDFEAPDGYVRGVHSLCLSSSCPVLPKCLDTT